MKPVNYKCTHLDQFDGFCVSHGGEWTGKENPLWESTKNCDPPNLGRLFVYRFESNRVTSKFKVKI
jgi:hypothetical protein